MTESDRNGAILFQAGSPARAETLGRANSSADRGGWRASGQKGDQPAGTVATQRRE